MIWHFKQMLLLENEIYAPVGFFTCLDPSSNLEPVASQTSTNSDPYIWNQGHFCSQSDGHLQISSIYPKYPSLARMNAIQWAFANANQTSPCSWDAAVDPLCT